ncbi:PqqD family protein [bacterium]|nr:PqqD family protein [candidate division CSSED10-310 bacterium]
MNRQSIYDQNPDVSCRPEEPEGGILYNPTEDTIELVNFTGLTIWRLLDGKSIPEIVSEMLGMFDGISEDALKEDVTEFILHLVDKRFIKEREPA